MAEGNEDSKKINLTVKTAKDKQTLEISEDASVKEVSRLSHPVIFYYASLFCSYLYRSLEDSVVIQ